MTQRIKAGDFYLEVPTAGTSLENHPGAEKPLNADKSDIPEPLEPKPYIFRPNDPFQSSIDRVEAAGNLAVTHKPWVKTAWLYVFVICPLIFMELFALAIKFQGNAGWRGFLIVHVYMLGYGHLSYSIWRNKAKGAHVELSSVTDKRNTAFKLTGIFFIVIGILMPVGATASGSLSSSQLASEVWRALSVLAGVMLVGWSATRESGSHKKACALLLVGLSFCTAEFFSLAASIREHTGVKAFYQQMVELKRQMALRDADFNRRMAGVPLGDVLQADNVVSLEGRTAGRATLAQFRALIAEREAARTAVTAGFRQLIDAVPSGDVKESARAGMNANHPENAKLAADLDQAQYQLADIYSAILDWCDKEAANLTLKDHQLQLSTALQETELNALLGVLRNAELREDEALGRVQAVGERGQREWDQNAPELGRKLSQ